MICLVMKEKSVRVPHATLDAMTRVATNRIPLDDGVGGDIPPPSDERSPVYAPPPTPKKGKRHIIATSGVHSPG